ncbi:ATP-binding cassette domain-containing protein [Treponema peruense]
MEKILEISNLDFSYKRKNVYENLNLSVNKGDVLGILGHNGAGKTTLFRLIGGILKPAGGSIKLFLNKGENIGFMPEGLGLYPRLSGKDNLELIFLRNNKNIDKNLIMQTLEEIKLKDSALTPIGEWSTGMKRRLSLIGALKSNTALCMLDEPFLGIDPVSQKIMLDYIKKIHSPEQTILVSCHDLNVIKQICNKIIIIKEGKIIKQTDSPDEISDIENIYFTLNKE